MNYKLVETKDKEIIHYFDYSLTKDLMEILGEDFKNYPLILESSWDRMLQFDIVLENIRLKKRYKIVFKNISLFYITKLR